MSFAFCLLLSLGLFILDQLSKLWVVTSLKPVGSINIIPGLLSFTYVENTGAAFGIFQGRRSLLIIVVTAVLMVSLWALYKNRVSGKLERFCVSLIMAGGLGNLTDRIRFGFVVDFIDINQLFSYPMFNLADCFVVAGAVLLMIAVVFEDKLKKKEAAAPAPEREGEQDAAPDNGDSPI